jgi:hypothetical protein
MKLFTVLVCLLGSSSVVAQEVGGVSQREALWVTLQSKASPSGIVDVLRERVSVGGRLVILGSDIAPEFLRIADDAKNFLSSEVDPHRRREAELIEAEFSLKAALAGDVSRVERGEMLVSRLRGDSGIPVGDRARLVGLSERVALRQKTMDAEDKTLLEFEKEASARRQILEFPADRQGYLNLLAVAGASGDQEFLEGVITQVEDSEVAPFEAKARARVLRIRCNLLGKSLRGVVSGVELDQGFEVPQGRKILVYTWTRSIPDSWVKGLNELSSAYYLVGVCIDQEISDWLPKVSGAFYVGEGGRGSRLALSLGLNEPGLVYVTDDGGVVTSVFDSIPRLLRAFKEGSK